MLEPQIQVFAFKGRAGENFRYVIEYGLLWHRFKHANGVDIWWLKVWCGQYLLYRCAVGVILLHPIQPLDKREKSIDTSHCRP